MNLDTRRWLILLAGILANLCQGTAYASSIFAPGVLKHLNLMLPNGKPDMAAWGTTFGWNLGFLPVGMLLSGKLSDKGNPRLAIIIGGILFGLGMFLAGWSNDFLWFKMTFGVMMGIGSGMAYGSVVAVAVKWFPDRRGLASGLAVGALGFGQFVIPPVANFLMNSTPASVVPVLFAFRVLGIAFIVIMGLSALILSNPPENYAPAGYAATPKAASAVKTANLSWQEMLTKGRFWLLYLIYACGVFSGLMIINHARIIAGNAHSASSGVPLSAKEAMFVVMVIGLANATGRILWGFISDKIGRNLALALMFAFTAAVMFMLPSLAGGQMTLIAAGVLIGMCFGGYLGTFPSLCADSFGPKNMSVNYALLFSAFSVSAIFGPMVAGQIKNATQSYDKAFLVAGAIAVIGFILAIILQASDKRKPVEA